jgi:hypothetical protein
MDRKEEGGFTSGKKRRNETTASFGFAFTLSHHVTLPPRNRWLRLVMTVHVVSDPLRVATKLCMRTDGGRGRENERYRESERGAEEADEYENENEE